MGRAGFCAGAGLVLSKHCRFVGGSGTPDLANICSARFQPEKTSQGKGYKMTMFCPSKDANQEMWHGARTGPEGAVEIFGADDVRSRGSFRENFDLTHVTSNSGSRYFSPRRAPKGPLPLRLLKFQLLPYLCRSSRGFALLPISHSTRESQVSL